MRKLVLTTLLIAATTGISRAQDAPSADPATNSIDPAPNASAADSATNTVNPAASTISLASPINHAGAIGLGPILGEPMGVTAKFWLSEKVGFDTGAAWSFVEPDGFQFYGDFLYHLFGLFHLSQGELPLYIGMGGYGKFPQDADNRAGLRWPVGVAYLLPGQHLEFFAEVVPVLELTPDTRLAWNGGVGLRYYFR